VRVTVAFTHVLQARKRIDAHVLRTPLRDCAALCARFDHPVRLKCEHQQITGSFKLRGATNAVMNLDAARREAGVTGASTGNHGRALAHAARAAGSRAIICMSKLVPANKVRAIEALGAEARIVGKSQDDAQVEAERLVTEEGMTMVPPFDMADIIAGQGTLGLEILEQAPDTQMLLVPLSGGGLIAGVALAARTLNPAIKIVGITMERGAAMHASLAAGKPVGIREVATLADSLGGGIGLDNRHTFAMVRDLVDTVVLVSEAEIAEAMRFAYFEEGEVIEGAAAVGIAALLAGKVVPEGPAAIILSGKNIDMALHRAIMAGEMPDFGAADA
jgi:threonine dehydratase